MQIADNPIFGVLILAVTFTLFFNARNTSQVISGLMGGVVGFGGGAIFSAYFGFGGFILPFVFFTTWLGVRVGVAMDVELKHAELQKRAEESRQQPYASNSHSDWEEPQAYRNSDFDYRRPPNSGTAQPQQQPSYSNLKKLPHTKRKPEDAKYWAIYEDPAAAEAEKEFAWRRLTDD